MPGMLGRRLDARDRNIVEAPVIKQLGKSLTIGFLDVSQTREQKSTDRPCQPCYDVTRLGCINANSANRRIRKFLPRQGPVVTRQNSPVRCGYVSVRSIPRSDLVDKTFADASDGSGQTRSAYSPSKTGLPIRMDQPVSRTKN